jgi:hypothetical protein
MIWRRRDEHKQLGAEVRGPGKINNKRNRSAGKGDGFPNLGILGELMELMRVGAPH